MGTIQKSAVLSYVVGISVKRIKQTVNLYRLERTRPTKTFLVFNVNTASFFHIHLNSQVLSG